MTRNLASDIASMLMGATLVFPVAVSDLLGGCSGRDNHRLYDPYHNDYHTWNQEEAGNYARWETETRREHRDFNQRNKDEQKEYWTWRYDRH